MSVDTPSSKFPLVVGLGSFLVLAALDDCGQNVDSSTIEAGVSNGEAALTAVEATRIEGCKVLLDPGKPLTGDQLERLVKNPDCFGKLNSSGITVAEAYDGYLDQVRDFPNSTEDAAQPATSLEKTYALSGLGMLMVSNCLYPNDGIKEGMDGQRVHVGKLLASTNREKYLGDKLPKGEVKKDTGVVLKKFDDGHIVVNNPRGIWNNWSDDGGRYCPLDKDGQLRPRSDRGDEKPTPEEVAAFEEFMELVRALEDGDI